MSNLDMREVIETIPEAYKPMKSVKAPTCESQFMWGVIVGLIPSLIYIISTQIYGN